MELKHFPSWSIIPDDFKLSNNLLEFKTKIRKWKAEKCPCRLCKIYIPGVGFIEYSGTVQTNQYSVLHITRKGNH